MWTFALCNFWVVINIQISFPLGVQFRMAINTTQTTSSAVFRNRHSPKFSDQDSSTAARAKITVKQFARAKQTDKLLQVVGDFVCISNRNLCTGTPSWLYTPWCCFLWVEKNMHFGLTSCLLFGYWPLLGIFHLIGWRRRRAEQPNGCVIQSPSLLITHSRSDLTRLLRVWFPRVCHYVLCSLTRDCRLGMPVFYVFKPIL